MHLTRNIVVALLLLWLLVGCRELPRYFASDTTLARVGGRELRLKDAKDAVPQGVSGADSAAFVQVYVDRWVRKQLKLQEAEILFSASEEKIDRMVEEYRQALLIRKLEQQYVDQNIDTTFTEDEIAAYYQAHIAEFKLDRPLVKGRVVRFDEGYRQAKKLKSLMESEEGEHQRDFHDLCEKNNFTVTDYRDRWVDFTEFLSYLPAVQSQNYDSMLAKNTVQEMRDSKSYYYFKIDAVLRAGDPIPMERLRSTIRRILFNRRQGEIIRNHEEELYQRGLEDGKIKIFESTEPTEPMEDSIEKI